MKRLLPALLIWISVIHFSLAQIKTTGVVTIPGTLSPMTIKLDMNNGTNLLTMTVTGPADRLFCIGFNSTGMVGTPDTVTLTKEGAYAQLAGGTVANPVPYIPAGQSIVLDTKGFTGYSAISLDTGNNDWTTVSDVSNLNVRTVVATRPLNTGNTTEDYTFNYSTLSNLNLIWAMWTIASPPPPVYADDGMWALSGKNTVGTSTRHSGSTTLTRGTVAVAFTTLGTTNFSSLEENISIYPNPGHSTFNIHKNNYSILISKVRIFDINAKLVKEISTDATTGNLAIDVSDLTKGVYFMEISNDDNKTVKKIIIE